MNPVFHEQRAQSKKSITVCPSVVIGLLSPSAINLACWNDCCLLTLSLTAALMAETHSSLSLAELKPKR